MDDKNSAQLAERLQTIEDHMSIARLRAQYCHYADERRWHDLTDLFAHDAEFAGLRTVRGSAQLLAFFEELASTMDAWWHMSHNETLELDGDRATGQAYFDAPCVVDGVPYVCAGRYDDAFVRRNGEWLFARRALTFFYNAPLHDGWHFAAAPQTPGSGSPDATRDTTEA